MLYCHPENSNNLKCLIMYRKRGFFPMFSYYLPTLITKNTENAAVSKQFLNKPFSKGQALKVISKLVPVKKMYMTIILAQKKNHIRTFACEGIPVAVAGALQAEGQCGLLYLTWGEHLASSFQCLLVTRQKAARLNVPTFQCIPICSLILRIPVLFLLCCSSPLSS